MLFRTSQTFSAFTLGLRRGSHQKQSSAFVNAMVSAMLMGISLTAGIIEDATAEVLNLASTLEEQLKALPPETIALIARERGDEVRGAYIFHTSAAGCIKCHQGNNGQRGIGPNLAEVKIPNDKYLVESLTHPSRAISKGFETQQFLMSDGTTYTGNVITENEDSISILPSSTPQQTIVLRKEEIDMSKRLKSSAMPEGLLSTFSEQRDFMDLIKYLMAITEGGEKKALLLKPDTNILAAANDTEDLDHRGIIQKFRSRDFDTGKGIFQGYCYGCHGRDGNQPSLPTARAFGTQKMKYGSDPYSMFKTLTFGNGLMASMRHLTPKERYQVIHYVREAFMKPSNDDYFEVTEEYLSSLPKGKLRGDERPEIVRDFKPALGSQLGRDFGSTLSIPLGPNSIAYNLHTMDVASVWEGDFLDVSETQHARDRGEGTVNPKGSGIPLLSQWKWGHDGEIDYPRDNLLPRGPLPSKWLNYRGYYQYDHKVILSYEIDGRSILELPGSNVGGITQQFQVGAGKTIQIALGEANGDRQSKAWIRVNDKDNEKATFGERRRIHAFIETDSKNNSLNRMGCTVSGDSKGIQFQVDSNNRIILTIPESDTARNFSVVRIVDQATHPIDTFATNLDSIADQVKACDFQQIKKGGNPAWSKKIETTGFLGLEQDGYAVDTLTIPDSNPWNSWLRTTSLDFFSDGRMAVATYGGDIWIVSGIDNSLKNLTWKRFAAGLYEPFGLRIIADKIYVTCKDRLVRLHDHNGDDEADFYENFSAEPDVSVNFHAFSFDLQTDEQGNFYYAKSGHGSDSTLPGMIYKISSDGKKREVFSTGFRTPNGLGMMPGNRLVGSDNQGQWMPASKINHLKKNAFYGWVPTYSIPGMWEPDGGKMDIKKVVAPSSFEQPIVWMPQEFDNSSGGQLWVDDERFGPLNRHLLHTSFGRGWVSFLMTQEISGVMQGAIVRLPLDFRTGVMRARTNPRDGQVYTTGLQGWNGGGRVGLKENGIQRLRYTGRSKQMLINCQVVEGGLKLTFDQEISPESCHDPKAFEIHHWNYKWRASYGSDQYRPSDDQQGTEQVEIEAITISSDHKTIKLSIPKLIPVDQLHLKIEIQNATGTPFAEEVYWTIHHTL